MIPWWVLPFIIGIFVGVAFCVVVIACGILVAIADAYSRF